MSRPQLHLHLEIYERRKRAVENARKAMAPLVTSTLAREAMADLPFLLVASARQAMASPGIRLAVARESLTSLVASAGVVCDGMPCVCQPTPNRRSTRK